MNGFTSKQEAEDKTLIQMEKKSVRNFISMSWRLHCKDKSVYLNTCSPSILSKLSWDTGPTVGMLLPFILKFQWANRGETLHWIMQRKGSINLYEALHGTVNNCPTSSPKNSPFRKHQMPLTGPLSPEVRCSSVTHFHLLANWKRGSWKTISSSSQKSINSVLCKTPTAPTLFIFFF